VLHYGAGGLFGLLGFCLLLAKKYRFNALSESLMRTAGINLIYGYLASGISNGAHIGGLISGGLCGVFFLAFK